MTRSHSIVSVQRKDTVTHFKHFSFWPLSCLIVHWNIAFCPFWAMCAFLLKCIGVEQPLTALLTLLSFLVCSLSLFLSDSISVLRSLPIPPRWCKREMTVSTGCFPLIDVVLSGSDPQKRHTFAPLIAHRSAKPREVCVQLISGHSPAFHRALAFLYPLPPLFTLLHTPLGSLGFLFNKGIFVLTAESS